MPPVSYGKVLVGDATAVSRAFANWQDQPVDQDLEEGATDLGDLPVQQTTLGNCTEVTGPGTFLGRAQRTLRFEPSRVQGWRFKRNDLPESLPINVSVANVWTTARNIVLCSGSPHNYMRMVEHIIALKVGLGLDNLLIRVDSGDPPLFDRGSLDLVEAVDAAGIVPQSDPAVYLTVREPVTVAGANGSFLTFLPAEDGRRLLFVDCAVDFRNAIGKQRIRFPVTPKVFRYGAQARTNTTLWMMLYCKTIGMIFADVRNLGYTRRNILVAGPHCYFNRPKLWHQGKSLEAVWHRATLDLLAAIALIDRGRLAGRVISYKSGHTLDVVMIRELYERDLLVRL